MSTPDILLEPLHESNRMLANSVKLELFTLSCELLRKPERLGHMFTILNMSTPNIWLESPNESSQILAKSVKLELFTLSCELLRKPEHLGHITTNTLTTLQRSVLVLELLIM